MQKQAPSISRLLTMVAFALSCFGLLLFLWLSFGGPVPLKPEGYRFEVAFPEATQLAIEADVRVAGVPVGKVRAKSTDPDQPSRTVAVIELERRYAPLDADARAILRQKTLLGETYVELTTGKPGGPTVPEGGRLNPKAVEPTTELDEILGALDPFTREAFRTWQQSLATAVDNRGQDLNDSFGNLPNFIEDGGNLLTVLDEQKGALGALVKNTGVVFGALTEREDQLRNLIINSDETFSAIADERDAFADIWRTFPTFLDESRVTFRRLDRFSRDTKPLFDELEPAARDLGPTLRAVGDFAPDLRRFFINLDPLITSSLKSLPALRELFIGLRPLLGELGPWLQQVNPLLEWIGVHVHTLTDMLANLGVATAARTPSADPQATGHYLRQFGPTGVETIAIHPNRLSTNRGNAYINPLGVAGPEGARSLILPNWDCNNAGGEKPFGRGTGQTPACRVQGPVQFQGRTQGRFPHVNAASYAGR